MSDIFVIPNEALTEREHQMAQAVSRGLRNRQIADEFGISEETVKKHLATIYGKLALPGRVALAVMMVSPRDGARITQLG